MLLANKKILILACLTLVSLFGCAQNSRQPSSQDQINPEAKSEISQVHSRVESEQFHRLSNVSVVYANYDLIKRDFPVVKDLSNDEIDQWLIHNAAFMSSPNAKTQAANTQVPIVSGEKAKGYRPPRYGRAAVFEAHFGDEAVGLIDVKGVGHFLNARAGPKSDGLATLGELIREVLFEKFMAMLLKDSNSTRGVVGSYAILDPGFRVKFSDGATKPAGILLRQAHDRQTDHGFLSHPQERMDLATDFKRYGVITHNNIQGTKAGDLFDFGHYYIETSEGDSALGARDSLWGYNPDFVAGLDEVDQFSPSIVDNPSETSNYLAERLASGEASRQDVHEYYKTFFEKVKFPNLIEGSSCQKLLESILLPN